MTRSSLLGCAALACLLPDLTSCIGDDYYAGDEPVVHPQYAWARYGWRPPVRELCDN